MVKKIALFLTKGYRFISKTLPPRCRFRPSCSIYAHQAIEIYGFFRGSFLAFKRIARCHPFCKGGFDPVPLPRKKI
ncbi:MAG: membrane protein insertion efficiency factor YidD [Endomicrobium sp.]|nr:membrane protein insertion efficiency factor YidD [Endomicrobium sp.]